MKLERQTALITGASGGSARSSPSSWPSGGRTWFWSRVGKRSLPNCETGCQAQPGVDSRRHRRRPFGSRLGYRPGGEGRKPGRRIDILVNNAGVGGHGDFCPGIGGEERGADSVELRSLVELTGLFRLP